MSIKKDLIVAVIGRSGSGKTFFINEVSKQLPVNVIKSYTTRPKRDENDMHIFIDTPINKFEDAANVPELKDKKIVAATMFNNNFYCMTEDQYKGKGISLYAVDYEGYMQLIGLETIDNSVEIFALYLDVDLNVCVENMYKRGDNNLSINSRIQHDNILFKEIPPKPLKKYLHMVFTNAKAAIKFLVPCFVEYAKKHDIEL